MDKAVVPVRLGGADGKVVGSAEVTREGIFLVARILVRPAFAPLLADTGGPFSISFQNEPAAATGSTRITRSDRGGQAARNARSRTPTAGRAGTMSTEDTIPDLVGERHVRGSYEAGYWGRHANLFPLSASTSAAERDGWLEREDEAQHEEALDHVD